MYFCLRVLLYLYGFCSILPIMIIISILIACVRVMKSAEWWCWTFYYWDTSTSDSVECRVLTNICNACDAIHAEAMNLIWCSHLVTFHIDIFVWTPNSTPIPPIINAQSSRKLHKCSWHPFNLLWIWKSSMHSSIYDIFVRNS